MASRRESEAVHNLLNANVPRCARLGAYELEQVSLLPSTCANVRAVRHVGISSTPMISSNQAMPRRLRQRNETGHAGPTHIGVANGNTGVATHILRDRMPWAATSSLDRLAVSIRR